MGGTQSKLFLKALKAGDEQKALDLYKSVEELKSMSPNRAYSHGMFHRNVTPLHLSAKRGLKELFKEFMLCGGVANLQDGQKRTVAHFICSTASGGDPAVAEIRAEMLQFLIDVCTNPSTVCPNTSKPLHTQPLDLNIQDKAFNTPLHLAATSGLVQCVKILLAHGVQLYLTNVAGQTPFACAEAAEQNAIVALLEPKMVFTETSESELVVQKPFTLRLESYDGIQQQDIQSIKTELILKTSSALDVPKHCAEELLQHFGWSQQVLVDSWLDDAVITCQQAKVRLPTARQTSLAVDVLTLKQTSVEEHICDICGDTCIDLIPNACGHAFCEVCWQEYLRIKVLEGKVVDIPCPGLDCDDHIAQEMVLRLVPSDLDSKYLKFDIGAFIEANPNTCWCPHPGCERVVHLPICNQSLEEPLDGSETQRETLKAPRNVDCGNGHFFCWACSQDAHDPCSCESWTRWKEKLLELGDGSDMPTSAMKIVASSETWIAKQCKPCPKCKTPIEKESGCNHMTCAKCSHDFCWVCFGRWAIHGSRTGGYYRCNRFHAQKKTKETLEAMKKEVEDNSKKRNTKYFKHVYRRYKNHSNSFKIEEALLTIMPDKMAALVASAMDKQQPVQPSLENEDVKFVKDAIRELLKARLALRSAYAMSYYVDTDLGRDDLIKLIAPLEKPTETLSEMIARPHLCTPKDKIILQTINSRDNRRKFLPRARKFNLEKKATLEFVDSENEEDPQSLSNSDSDSDYSDWDSDSDYSYAPSSFEDEDESD